MPTVLPNVPGGHFIAPLSRNVTSATDITSFEDDSQQRFVNRPILATFVLNYRATLGNERALLDAFVASTVGSFDTTWTFSFVPTIPGLAANYLTCGFEDDFITWTENRQTPLQFDGSIRFRQARTGGEIGPGVLGPFPVFGPSPGSVTGYPFITTTNYYVARVDLPSGIRSAYYFTGGSGFASRGLQAWTITLPDLSNSDLGILESHFVSAVGSYHLFSFTDPNSGKTYPRVQYSSDTFAVKHRGYGLNSVTVKLNEVYGPGWTA